MTIGFTPVLANQLASPIFAHGDGGVLRAAARGVRRGAGLAGRDRRRAPASAGGRSGASGCTGSAGSVPRRSTATSSPRSARSRRRAGSRSSAPPPPTASSRCSPATRASGSSSRWASRSTAGCSAGRPQGCWLPECAYRPRGPWAPWPTAPRSRMRRGIEEHLADAGFRFFFVDAHLASAGPAARPLRRPGSGDPERRTQPAERDSPSAQRSPYRAYRVAPPRQAATASRVRARPAGVDAGLEPPRGLSRRRRVPRVPQDPLARRPQALAGHRPDAWTSAPRSRTTRPGARPRARAPCRPLRRGCSAASPAAEPREPRRRDRRAVRHRALRPLVVRGPDFLGRRYRALRGPARRATRHRLRATCADHPPRAAIRLPSGSWGANGDFSMWLNEQTAWTWERLWPLEERFWDVAPDARCGSAQPAPVLAQAARELLLAQSSDWQFIISTGAAADYAERRFREHCDDTEELVAALVDGSAEALERGSRRRGGQLGQRDELFPDVLPAIAAALGGLPLPRARLSRGTDPVRRSASICISPSATSITSSPSTSTTSTARCSTRLAERELLPGRAAPARARCSSGWRRHEPAYLDRLGAARRRRPDRAPAGGLLRAGARLAAARGPGGADPLDARGGARGASVSRRAGLWLTERVWEPELAADLADAGVRYALVDDRHFLVTGFSREQLHAPFWTESDGKRVGALPDRRAAPLPDPVPSAGGDRRLPARAPRRRARPGGPGRRRREVRRLARHEGVGLRAGAGSTASWRTIGGLVESGEVVLSTLDDALRDGAERRARLSADRVLSRDGGLVAPARRRAPPRPARARSGRGAHRRARRRARSAARTGATSWSSIPSRTGCTRRCWRCRALCRRRGRPARGAPRHRPGAVQRRLLARRLRRALPAAPARRDLAQSGAGRSGSCAAGEGLAWEVLDLDGDGHDEIWVHSAHVLRAGEPGARRRVGGVHRFRGRINYADVLTRRRRPTMTRRARGRRKTQGGRRHARASTTSKRDSACTAAAG